MLLPFARDCSDLVASSNTMASYLILAYNQIGTALTSGSRSCTLTTTGKAGADIAAVEQNLRQQGFIVTSLGATLTISWATA